MIKSVALQNFQSHKKSKLIFDKGVNVIKGTSHHGKSSIMRGLRWALFNKPQGFSFKRHGIKDKEDCSITINFDTGTVKRLRNKKENKYILKIKETDEVYEAMRSDVPDTVKNVTGIKEINMQSQHDTHFLLQETAGEVGRKLNNIVGLSIIDKSQKIVNKEINDLKNTIKSTKSYIEKKEEVLLSFDFLTKAGKKIKDLEKFTERFNNISDSVISLKTLISTITELDADIVDNTLWLEVEKPAKNIVSKIEKMKQNNAKHSSLQNVVQKCREYSEEISQYSILADIDLSKIKNNCMSYNDIAKAISTLTKIIQNAEINKSIIKDNTLWMEGLDDVISSIKEKMNYFKNISEKISKLISSCNVIAELCTDKNKYTDNLQKKEEEYNKLYASLEVCPLCGTALK